MSKVRIEGIHPGFSTLGMNRTVVSIDLTSATWNTLASHEVFTVTGLVRCLVFWRITEGFAGIGASVQFGREGATSEYALSSVVGNFTAGTFVIPGGTVATNDEAGNFLNSATLDADMLLDGLDIGYEITGAALTDGTIQAICFWTPISPDGAVVAGAGGVL